MKEKMRPSGRSFDEISAQAQREFFEANGYHPTEEDCIRLTEEARAEIANERKNLGGKVMNDCLFCKIIAGEIPSTKIYEDEQIFVFADIAPTAPVHWLAIPKEHIAKLSDVNESNSAVISHIYEVISKLAAEHGEFENGFRVVSNCGESAGQSVFHIHFHVLAGRDFAWPAG